MAFSLTISTHQLDKPILQALDSTGVLAQAHTPGYTVKSDDGREFAYIKFDNGSGDVAAVAGAPAVWYGTTTNYTVTSDVDNGNPSGIAGAFLSILTDTYYGWIQTKGILVDAPSSGNQAVLAAKALAGASADAVWSYMVDGGTEAPGVVALETGTGGYGDVMLLDK